MSGWGALLGRFAAGPALVRSAWEESPPAMRATPGAEGWSANDAVIHIADAELVRAYRIRIMCAGDARIDAFDEDAWRTALAYRDGDPALALVLYEAVTASTVDLLRRLGEPAGSRSAPHPEFGDITIATLVERGIEHAAAHAAQVRELTGG
ncbi:MAG: DinB family protein [Dehalococcoidia bacterium]